MSVGGSEQEAEPHRERLGWISLAGGRRRKEARRDMLLALTERAEEPCLVQKLIGMQSRGYLQLYVTGIHSSSVPWIWDPHFLDLVWSLDVLLREGTLTWEVTQAVLCEG